MPALWSNVQFYRQVASIRVTGVTRHYDEPPASLDFAEGLSEKVFGGSCAFPLMPSSERGTNVSSCVNHAKTRSMDYVVVLEPTGQATQSENYALLDTAMDNLESAIETMESGVNHIQHDIGTTGNFSYGGQEYWAVVANIRISEA